MTSKSHGRSNEIDTIVIYPDRRADKGGRLHYSVLLESTQVHTVYLEDFRNQGIEGLGLQLVQLIIADTADLGRSALAQVNELPSQNQILDLIETIMVYKLPRLNREEIQKMLGLTDIDLKQTQFYKDVFTEGQQEGKQDGQAELVIHLLVRRFGMLDRLIISDIRQLSLDRLESLADVLLDLDSEADVRDWLDRI